MSRYYRLGWLAGCFVLGLAACGRSPISIEYDGWNPADPDAGPALPDTSTPDRPIAPDSRGPDVHLWPWDLGHWPDAAPVADLPPVKPDAGPKKPDLIIKNFTAKNNGANIDYSYEVCNVGTAKVLAMFFRVDLYYNSFMAPSGLILGDTSTMIFGGLAVGACKKLKKTYKNPPVGLYWSRVRADALNSVKESNEKNNTAGPKMLSVSAPSGCSSLCGFSIGCGEFKLWEYSLCLTWCKNLGAADRKCADQANKKKSCSDLKKCKLPAKPILPTPLTCYNVCSYLNKTCNLVKANQLLICMVGCATLPDTKKTCALKAMGKKQCASMMICLL